MSWLCMWSFDLRQQRNWGKWYEKLMEEIGENGIFRKKT